MPVTRNRLSNQKSDNPTGDNDVSSQVAAAASDPDSRSQSRNSNVSEKNNNDSNNSTMQAEDPAPAPRMLRDRASLAAKAAALHQAQLLQQQQPQHETSKSSHHVDDDSESTKRNQSKGGVPPTRVLSRRSSFRPQSLLKREASDSAGSPQKSHNVNQVPTKSMTAASSEHPSNQAAKKLRREEPARGSHQVEGQGLDLTKRPIESANRLSAVQMRPGSNPASLVKRDRLQPQSAVRISLPGNPTPTSSNVPKTTAPIAVAATAAATTNLNGSQAPGAKKFGLIPLGAKIASEIRSRMASGTSLTAASLTNRSKAATAAAVVAARAAVANSAKGGDSQQRHPQSLLTSDDRRQVFNILIAVTGSVATVKLIEFIRKLHHRFPQAYTHKVTNRTSLASISIRVIMTQHSKHFVNKGDIQKCVPNKKIEVYDDADEWTQWSKMGDPVLHIELRKWADLCVIAPLDANTMAKLANGICDNLLTCVVRAWDTSKRLIYCPAMNVHMYNHPITKEQLCKLQSFGYLRVDCIEKTLACGDVGLGAMANVDTITAKVVETLLRPVPRLISPTKPLLTQQPTYQIMSTSDKPAAGGGGGSSSSGNGLSGVASPASAVNLLSRFRASDQVSMRTPTNNSSIKSLASLSNGNSPATSMNSYQPKSSTPQSSGFNLLFATKHQQPRVMGRDVNNQKSQQQQQLLLQQQKSKQSSLVQSLNNLKAINPDLSMTEATNGVHNHNFQDEFEDDYEDEDEQDEDDDGEGEGEEEEDEYDDDDDMADYVEDGGLDLSSPEADNYGHDLDPSRLLEQSLITNEEPAVAPAGRQSRGGSVNSFGNLSSASNTFNTNMSSVNRSAADPFTPFFNTSKFLSMCYVKERNCFNCAICKNDYKNRKSMSRHLREQHVQGNIYQCEPCGVGFKRREKLIKHNRDRHGIAIEQPINKP